MGGLNICETIFFTPTSYSVLPNRSKDEFVDSNFDLFGKTEYEVGVKKIVSQIFRPLSSPNTSGPFTFKIPSDPDKFTNAQSLRLHGRMRIKKRDRQTEALSL